MRLGIYGGSFDPIHRGHVEPLRHGRQAMGLDRVLYLPTARPPHKTGRQLASATARYTMVELALLHEEGLQADDFEMQGESASYTIDTLEHFRRRQPDIDVVLFVGSDAFLSLMTWHRWQDILSAAQVAVLMRPGAADDDFEKRLAPPLRQALDDGRAVLVPPGPRIDISSSRLRQLLADGNAEVEQWVPQLVLDYIHKYELYR